MQTLQKSSEKHEAATIAKRLMLKKGATENAIAVTHKKAAGEWMHT